MSSSIGFSALPADPWAQVELERRSVISPNIYLTTTAGPADLNRTQLSVKNDGTLSSLSPIYPGRYRVHVPAQSKANAEITSDYYLVEARFDGRVVTNDEFEIAAFGELKIKIGQTVPLDGVVVDAQDQPFTGAGVVLIPDPPLRDRKDLYRVAYADMFGRFSIRAAPGSYKVIALDELPIGSYLVSDFATRNESHAIPVRLDKTGQTGTRLKVVRADQ